jgi:hypothetical protein
VALAKKEEIILTVDGPPESIADLPLDEDDPALIRSRLEGRPPSDEAIAKFEDYC